MGFIFSFFAAAVSSIAVLLAVGSARHMPEQVSAGESRLRMFVAGTDAPTVVFDCFGAANLELWNRVQPEVAKFTRTVSYDHGGYWGSEPGPKPRDARQIARELRAALRNAGIEPPYVLAGYSLGGPYVRVFAGLYPDEVAGLILIDPTQEKFMEWLAQAFPEFAAVSARHLDAQDEVASSWASLKLAEESRLPAVPMTLITGFKPQGPLSRYALPRWLAEHQAWLSAYPHARHIVTTNSGHDVVLREPALVVEAIRGVVGKARLAR